MAAGVPLIAVMSPKSEIAQIVKEEGCGIVVELGEEKVLADGILRLYNDKAQLKQMGANALMVIQEKYNLDKISRKYIDLIGQVV
jgi:glycosyltransferase involved in cell wall biosynthesis